MSLVLDRTVPQFATQTAVLPTAWSHTLYGRAVPDSLVSEGWLASYGNTADQGEGEYAGIVLVVSGDTLRAQEDGDDSGYNARIAALASGWSASTELKALGVFENTGARHIYSGSSANTASAGGLAGSFPNFDRMDIGALTYNGTESPNYFDGAVHEIALWEDLAMSTAEMDILFQGVSPIVQNRANLSALYRMIPGALEVDFLGRAHLTLTGSPTGGATGQGRFRRWPR